MSFLSLLRRPSVLASVALHAALGGVAFGHSTAPAPVSRPAELRAMWCSDTTGSVDAMEVPPPPDVVPRPEEVPVAEPMEVLPPPEEELTLPDADGEETPVLAERGPGLPPVGVRRAPLSAPTSAAPAPVRAEIATTPAPAVAAPVPAPARALGARELPSTRPASAASRAGSRVNRDASALATNAPPAYPVEALRNGWEGTVLVEIRTDAMGAVVLATLARSSGYPALDAAALTAARAWQFSPRLVEGVPAPDWFQKPVVFTLRRATAMR